MTPDYIDVQENWTIDQVLQHVRRVGKDSESLNAVYVVDAEKHLIDDIRMREILLSQPESIVAELMDRKYAALQATDAETDAVETFRKYDRTVLPVVDRRGLLLGVSPWTMSLTWPRNRPRARFKSLAVSKRSMTLCHNADAANGQETSDLARDSFPRRDAHRLSDGRLRR